MFIEQNLENFWQIKQLDKFMFKHKGFIAGGCFKNIFNNEKVKDVDIFFENETDYLNAVEYFDGECGENNKDGVFRFYYENKKVKAYKHIGTNVAVELVQYAFGAPEEILDMFDFTITKFAYFKKEVVDDDLFPGTTSLEYSIIHNEKFFEHLHLKRLVLDNQILYPVSTFERMFRYAKYGYFPCKESKLKIINALRKIDSLDDLSLSLYEGLD